MQASLIPMKGREGTRKMKPEECRDNNKRKKPDRKNFEEKRNQG